MYIRYQQLEEQHDVRRLNHVSFVLGVISAFSISIVANFQVSKEKPVVDPGFLRGGGANPPGGANIRFRQNFPKNCMKLKEFGPPGGREACPSRPLRSATGLPVTSGTKGPDPTLSPKISNPENPFV